jgi:hypothetical protein
MLNCWSHCILFCRACLPSSRKRGQLGENRDPRAASRTVEELLFILDVTLGATSGLSITMLFLMPVNGFIPIRQFESPGEVGFLILQTFFIG